MATRPTANKKDNLRPHLQRLADSASSSHSSSARSSGSLGAGNAIIVPDVGCSYAQALAVINLIRTIAPHSKILYFEFAFRLQNEDAWTYLWNLGDALFKLIDTEMKQEGTTLIDEPSLVMFSYGLGGVVVKRALNSIHQSLAYRNHAKALKGIIFFSVPHPTTRHRERWPKLATMLRLLAPLTKKQLLDAEQYAATVSNEAMEFESACLEVPIFSIYETKPTKTRSWWTSKSLVILVCDTLMPIN
ncbi:hypothetical protein VTL71DRAFT_4863 [Oculimacula yallundae]|uniref:DUF676 domain-containing protein n=1 Tax=Oculimacula yallundae TaxID=86028 RepID=A0ABR4C4Y6_9HELO